MPSPAHGLSRDRNEPDIVAAFEKLGWLVVRHSAYDLDICCPVRSHILAVEVKKLKPKGRLTPSQNKLIQRGWPLNVVYCVADAVAVVTAHRCGRVGA